VNNLSIIINNLARIDQNCKLVSIYTELTFYKFDIFIYSKNMKHRIDINQIDLLFRYLNIDIYLVIKLLIFIIYVYLCFQLGNKK